ncbi:MAG: prepilin-type N-terminal cleavage/methylation domain-containing protein [Bdellovibrionales bacterium]|nr:prepilin-type N-terminal cleavage/methylation domain-containing protein [Bdellovibrionales bacterium]
MTNATNGFSLLEMLISLSLLSVLFALSLPQFSKLKRDTAVSESTHRIKLLIEEAILVAQATATKHVVQITQQQVIISRYGAGSPESSISLPPGITLFSNSSSFQIASSGVVQPKRVLVVSDSQYCEIVISLRGRVRTQCNL